MTQKDTSSFVFRNIYPRMRYAMGLGRNLYQFGVDLRTRFSRRPLSSSVRPDAYTACNTDTLDSEIDLDCLSGEMPTNIDGSLSICQCLGAPKAFMIGDTNIVRLDFGSGRAQ